MCNRTRIQKTTNIMRQEMEEDTCTCVLLPASITHSLRKFRHPEPMLNFTQFGQLDTNQEHEHTEWGQWVTCTPLTSEEDFVCPRNVSQRDKRRVSKILFFILQHSDAAGSAAEAWNVSRGPPSAVRPELYNLLTPSNRPSTKRRPSSSSPQSPPGTKLSDEATEPLSVLKRVSYTTSTQFSRVMLIYEN